MRAARGILVLALYLLVVLLALPGADSNWLSGLGRALGRLRPGQRHRQQQQGRGRESEALGLRNLGNTCYLNSVLQSLFYVREFRDGVLSAEFAKPSAGHDLQKIFRDLSATNKGGRWASSVDTYELVRILDINVGIQEDAQEFYLRLLNAVDGDSEGGNEESKFASRAFAGETEQIITCKSVAYQSRKKQRFLDLSLDASRVDDLEQSLRLLFSEKESIEGYRTPEHGKQDAERALQLAALPRALCLHLKRFNFDPELMSISKLGRRIAFPFALDLAPLLQPKPQQQSQQQQQQQGAAPSLYDLAAIVVHEGTATAGHYVSYARPDIAAAPQLWLKLDDHAVTRVSEDAVREASFGGGAAASYMGGAAASRNAYMLFYTQR